MSVEFDKIKKLITLVEKNGLSELSVEEDNFSVTIKAESAEPHVTTSSASPISEGHEEQVQQPEEVPAESHFQIKSPMIGVFYRRPSPDSLPFVEVGDQVEFGQTIGLIEAMKVFSEVPSEVDGIIVAMPVDNGKLVHQGDVLAVIDASSVY
jgi:acetyl-CoA carboxylase biotin carboxyl carrier protein